MVYVGGQYPFEMATQVRVEKKRRGFENFKNLLGNLASTVQRISIQKYEWNKALQEAEMKKKSEHDKDLAAMARLVVSEKAKTHIPVGKFGRFGEGKWEKKPEPAPRLTEQPITGVHRGTGEVRQLGKFMGEKPMVKEFGSAAQQADKTISDLKTAIDIENKSYGAADKKEKSVIEARIGQYNRELEKAIQQKYPNLNLKKLESITIIRPGILLRDINAVVTDMSPEDKEALEWANKNRWDKKAKTIRLMIIDKYGVNK